MVPDPLHNAIVVESDPTSSSSSYELTARDIIQIWLASEVNLIPHFLYFGLILSIMPSVQELFLIHLVLERLISRPISLKRIDSFCKLT